MHHCMFPATMSLVSLLLPPSCLFLKDILLLSLSILSFPFLTLFTTVAICTTVDERVCFHVYQFIPYKHPIFVQSVNSNYHWHSCPFYTLTAVLRYLWLASYHDSYCFWLLLPDSIILLRHHNTLRFLYPLVCSVLCSYYYTSTFNQSEEHKMK